MISKKDEGKLTYFLPSNSFVLWILWSKGELLNPEFFASHTIFLLKLDIHELTVQKIHVPKMATINWPRSSKTNGFVKDRQSIFRRMSTGPIALEGWPHHFRLTIHFCPLGNITLAPEVFIGFLCLRKQQVSCSFQRSDAIKVWLNPCCRIYSTLMSTAAQSPFIERKKRNIPVLVLLWLQQVVAGLFEGSQRRICHPAPLYVDHILVNLIFFDVIRFLTLSKIIYF